MMKLSDYVMDFLSDKGIEDVFLVSGGNSMHLLESLGNHPTLKYTCNHHEQASAMAAEGYARVTGNFGVCLVSSGPAQTNALTGLMCAWEDSVPVMFISGNCSSQHLKNGSGLRQRGVHEVDILPMVEDVTKYSVRITHPESIRYHLEKAHFLMTRLRKGPVWLDIPVNVQAMMVDPEMLEGFTPKTMPALDNVSPEFLALYLEAKRPVVLIGGGAVSSLPKLLSWLEDKEIPSICTKNAFGYIPSDTLYYAGMIGINGNRAANLLVQNADLLIILGSRLALPATGYSIEHFASKAKKIVVDIDAVQLEKSFVKFDLTYRMYVSDFMDQVIVYKLPDTDWEWICWVDQYKQTYHLSDNLPSSKYVSSPFFFDELWYYMDQNSTKHLVVDQGAAFYSWSQFFWIEGSTSFTNGGFSPMGYGLPAAIGACVASGKPVVCVIGDGGFEMNIQELQTIAHYKLPIKIFVFNNDGYGSIKNTQDAYFKGHYVGSDPSSGVSCVNARKIAEAYGIPSYTIHDDKVLRKIETAFAIDGPVIVEVLLDPHQAILPKVQASVDKDVNIKPGKLEDMTPLLERDRLRKLMGEE